MIPCCAQVTTREEQTHVRVTVGVPWCVSMEANGMLKEPQAGDTDALQKDTLVSMQTSDIC